MTQPETSEKFFNMCPGCHAAGQIAFNLRLIYYRLIMVKLNLGCAVDLWGEPQKLYDVSASTEFFHGVR